MKNLFTCFVLSSVLMAPFTGSSQVNLNNGLMAYYPFNGNFQDMSGNNNYGNGQNGVAFGTDNWGNPNAAAYFDGVDDWFYVNSAPSITATNKLTLSFRYKAASSLSQQVIVSKSDYYGTNTINDQQFQIGIFCSQSIGNDNLFFATDHDGNCTTTSSNFGDYLFSSEATTADQWYCVVMTFDTKVKKIYVDGVLTGQQITSGSSIDSCDGGVLKFGTWWQNDLLYYKGLLDEVRLYKRVLNTEEIDSLCNYNPENPDPQNVIASAYRSPIKIFPNPVSENFNVSVPADWKSYSINIYNGMGQRVYASEMKQSSVDIASANFPPGLYFIKLEHAGQTFMDKFIKQ